jgi:hypothetical protein
MRKQRLSLKKLSEQEALEKISHLSMQLQTEKENLQINYYPNRQKSLHELDRTLQFCLSVDNYTSMEDCIVAAEKRINDIEWKMNEDFGRFVPKGLHIVSSGHIFIKS